VIPVWSDWLDWQTRLLTAGGLGVKVFHVFIGSVVVSSICFISIYNTSLKQQHIGNFIKSQFITTVGSHPELRWSWSINKKLYLYFKIKVCRSYGHKYCLSLSNMKISCFSFFNIDWDAQSCYLMFCLRSCYSCFTVYVSKEYQQANLLKNHLK